MFAPKFRIAAGLVLGHSFLAKNHRNDSPSSSSLVQYRPDSNRYQRIDSILESAHPEWKSNNAFHGTLQGENLIEKYEVYANSEEGDIICLVKYGCSLNGHTGIIHGGITAITFDNSFGWLFLANKTPPAFTANLSINYRFGGFIDSFIYFCLGERSPKIQLWYYEQKYLNLMNGSCLWLEPWRMCLEIFWLILLLSLLLWEMLPRMLFCSLQNN